MNGIELNPLNNEQHSPLLESGLKSSFINDRRPSLDEEDSFTENGDDEEALLGGGDRERSFAQPKRWPQVKGIVLEVIRLFSSCILTLKCSRLLLHCYLRR